MEASPVAGTTDQLIRLGTALQSQSRMTAETDRIGDLLAKMVRRQQLYLEAFGSTFRDLVSSAEEIAATCGRVKDQTTRATAETTTISSLGSKLVNTVNESRDQVGTLKGVMANVGEAVALFSTIVRQTRFLSLNAAIEANTAGAAGAGFAVIADEIKVLSQSAQDALDKIAQDIAAGSKSIANLVEKLTGQIDDVNEMVDTTSQSIGNINSEIETIGEAVQRITSDTRTQSTSLHESLATLDAFTAMSGRSSEIVEALGEVNNDLLTESKKGGAAFQLLSSASEPTDELAAFRISYEIMEQLINSVRQTHDTREILQTIVDLVCERVGWSMAHVFTPDAEGVLRCSKIWHIDSNRRSSEFFRMSESVEFRPGQGLPGRVYQSRKLEWIPDVTIDANFPRAEAAKAIGIVSGMAFPVMTRRKEVVAVIEYFACREQRPGETLITILEQIGQVIGQVDLSNRILQDLNSNPVE